MSYFVKRLKNILALLNSAMPDFLFAVIPRQVKMNICKIDRRAFKAPSIYRTYLDYPPSKNLYLLKFHQNDRSQPTVNR
jgi:hypothetical protein